MKATHQLTLRWESVLDYPMKPRGRGRERFEEDARLLALKMRKGTQAKEYRQSLHAGKGRERAVPRTSSSNKALWEP